MVCNWHSFVCWKWNSSRISFIAKDAKDGKDGKDVEGAKDVEDAKDGKDGKDVEDASVARGLGAPSLNFRPLNYVGPLQGGTGESSKENMGGKDWRT